MQNSNNHGYGISRVYRVVKTHSDGTFIAMDSNGQHGDWIPWADCEAAGTGWDWLCGQLDARSLDLLSAFDGAECLQLRYDVEAWVIISIPNLAAAILDILPSLNVAAEYAGTDTVADVDGDDGDHGFLNADFMS
jgi:hypothetical protein